MEISLKKSEISVKNRYKSLGQVTIEYIIVVAAIVGILIVFFAPGGGLFQGTYNESATIGTVGLRNLADRLSTSRPPGGGQLP